VTRERDFKRLVRARMSTTGERYTAARAALLRGSEEVDMVPVTCEVKVIKLTEEQQERIAALVPEGKPRFELDDDVEDLLVGIKRRDRQPWLVLTEVGGSRELTIWCGAVEATAVALALRGFRPERPMTHDLLRDVVAAIADAREVRITEARDNTFFAELLVEDSNGNEQFISCRPSDGIALAIRADIPILVAESLFPDTSAPDMRKDEK